MKISLSGPAALSGNQKRTRIRIAGLALFVALYIGLPAAVEAAYQQFLPGTDIYFGEFVYDDDFVATTTAGCTMTVYDPSGSLVVNAATMTVDPNGFYAYSFTPTETRGVWPASMSCGSALNGSLVKLDKTFEISDNVVSSSSVAALVNANTNLAVATASSSLSATLPNSIWAFSGRTLTSFGTLVADIWASGTRTLTGFGTLAADVWTSATRTLTAAGLTSGSLALQSDVTTASSSLGTAITNSQTAINANTNSQILTASTSLASFINTNTNAIVLAASSSLGAQFNVLGATIAGIPAAVWNITTASLSSPGSIGKLIVDNLDVAVSTVSGGGGLTAVDIWTYGTRTLTAATLTSGALALQADVQTASSSIAAIVNANTDAQVAAGTVAVNAHTDIASSSIAAVVNANTDAEVLVASTSLASNINTNTNAIVLAASSSLGAQFSSLASSIASIPTNVWAAGTRTLTGFGTLAADVWTNGTRTLTGAGLTSGSLATLSDVQTASSSLGAAVANSEAAINANTDAEVLAASTSLASNINTNTNAQVLTASTSLGLSLSSIASSITSIPTNVWAAGTRTLTGFGTLAADVWTNGTRTLTGAGLSSGSLATLSDVQIASSSVAAVVNSNTNATVLAASSSLATSIPVNVWNASVRTLSSFGTLASDVWSAASRTLTAAGLTSGSLATLSDVQTASSSLGAAITNSETAINANTDAEVLAASTSLASNINTNTNAQVLTASTSLGLSLSSIAS
ncbi:MAG TPA: hypothetical protein PK109_02070, partial [Candidatus Paceibacterota bacterium]|nr:hypothetical protein [Candidatus Paceibacterota bacterium]